MAATPAETQGDASGASAGTSSEARGPPPAPGVRTELLSVPEGRLETEVQSLLVGADLSNLTIGQLRGQLEQRLGLKTGALGSRKRLRRQVSRAVQEEVVRKSSRSADVERIVKALIDFEEYPAGPRQMLISCLPRAVSRQDGEQHPHQARLLLIARDAVAESRRVAEAKLGVLQADLESYEKELDVLSARLAEAQQNEAGALRDVAAAEASLAEAELAATRAQEELSSREDAKRVAATAKDVLLEQRQAFAGAVAAHGAFTLLVEGIWEQDGAKMEALASVDRLLTELGVEVSLHDAAAIALKRTPAERGKFDCVTVASVEGLFRSHVEKLDERLAAGGAEEALSKTMALSAAALLSAADANASSLRESLAASRGAAAAAVEARTAAAKQVASQSELLEGRRRERGSQTDRLQEIDRTLAIVDSLAAPTPAVSKVEPGAVEAAAALAGSEVEAQAAPAETDDSKTDVVEEVRLTATCESDIKLKAVEEVAPPPKHLLARSRSRSRSRSREATAKGLDFADAAESLSLAATPSRRRSFGRAEGPVCEEA